MGKMMAKMPYSTSTDGFSTEGEEATQPGGMEETAQGTGMVEVALETVMEEAAHGTGMVEVALGTGMEEEEAKPGTSKEGSIKMFLQSVYYDAKNSI
jgi:hypothetical protein